MVQIVLNMRHNVVKFNASFRLFDALSGRAKARYSFARFNVAAELAAGLARILSIERAFSRTESSILSSFDPFRKLPSWSRIVARTLLCGAFAAKYCNGSSCLIAFRNRCNSRSPSLVRWQIGRAQV